ncbi:type III pantothenate kinase [Dehalogenimonas sp. THU2]|uniref:type III pantothenate kinase n=1 Tax=Dehalogenimonas sp. THU2 TaxID=3151121 RepID=UPI0032183220
MLLVIDIGNTSISLGIYDGDKLKVSLRVATVMHRLPDEYASLLLHLLDINGIDPKSIGKVTMCSVVPPLTDTFEILCRRYFNTDPLVVGAGVKTGVKIRMDNPAEVGADRIVNAAAAFNLYRTACIVVDLGTATTFDTVSATGDYIGGAIAPGLTTAAEALTSKTSMLPRIELHCPEKAIGTSTIKAMQSGLVFGYVGLVEGIVGRIQKELPSPAKVIATGGYAELLNAETKVFDILSPDLTLYGLRLIYFMNRA